MALESGSGCHALDGARRHGERHASVDPPTTERGWVIGGIQTWDTLSEDCILSSGKAVAASLCRYEATMRMASIRLQHASSTIPVAAAFAILFLKLAVASHDHLAMSHARAWNLDRRASSLSLC